MLPGGKIIMIATPRNEVQKQLKVVSVKKIRYQPSTEVPILMLNLVYLTGQNNKERNI